MRASLPCRSTACGPEQAPGERDRAPERFLTLMGSAGSAGGRRCRSGAGDGLLTMVFLPQPIPGCPRDPCKMRGTHPRPRTFNVQARDAPTRPPTLAGCLTTESEVAYRV